MILKVPCRLGLRDFYNNLLYPIPCEAEISSELFNPLYHLQLIELGQVVRSSVRSIVNEEDF